MTKQEFIGYVRGVLDSERSELTKAELQDSEIEFIGPLGLIDKALNEVKE